MKSRLLLALFSIFSVVSFGQVISIGSPVDGIEGNSDVSFTVFIEGGGTNNTGIPISGSIVYSGTATNSADYTPIPSFSIPVGANSTVIVVPIINDNLFESCELLSATIGNVNIGTINNATENATIYDDDFGGTLSIGSPVNGLEPGTNGSFVVSIDNGLANCTGVPITGTISYSGTAINGSDYTGASSFSIPVGSNSTTITITVIDDVAPEPTETVDATISNLSVGSVGNGSSTVNILDDDSGSLIISIGSPTDAVEGTSDITYSVFIEGGAVNSTGIPITGSINYGGSGSQGVDFTGATSFSIPVGANSTTVTVTVIDDFLVEPTETVIANLVGSPNIGVYGNTSSTANIMDDDAVNIEISIDSIQSGGELIGDVSFVVFLDFGAINNTGSDITGSINYSGTATTSADFSSGSSTFTIPNGHFADTIVLNVIDDVCIESTETVIATISNPSIGSINNGTSTAYILDNDAPTATVSIGTPTDGAEGGADVTFTISIDAGLINCTGAPINGSVTFSGTATSVVDYSAVSSFSIPDGNTFVILSLPVIDDVDVECDETVIATISNLSVGTVNSTASTSTAIIEDDECMNSLDEINDFGLSVYPNPVTDHLNFQADQQMSTYSIIDLNGRTIVSGRIDAVHKMISAEDLSRGSYFVKIQFENGAIVNKKILKE